MVLFVGDDWAEAHHDVEIQDEQGRRLAVRRLPEGVVGIAGLHALLAEHLGADATPSDVVVGIETDRGPWVQALLAAGYQVFAINPMSGRATEKGTSPPEPRAIQAMRGCSPTWCALIGSITGQSLETATSPRPSRSSPARTRT